MLMTLGLVTVQLDNQQKWKKKYCSGKYTMCNRNVHKLSYIEYQKLRALKFIDLKYVTKWWWQTLLTV